jgi:predicted RND superfamily exporter protein
MLVESREPNLNLSQEKAFQDEITRRVRSFQPRAADPTLKIQFSGSSRVEEYRALIRDLKVAGAVSGVLIFLPLLIRFRRPSYVLGVFFPLVLGIPIGLGLASLWIQKLSVTTSFLFAILGGLGVETGIHLFSRYLEERRFGKSVEEALVDLFVSMGPAVLTSVSTLAVTFLLMIFGNFRGFSEFGFISGVGLYVLFLMYFSVFPAGLVLLEKLKRIRVKPVAVEHARKIRFSPGFVRVMLGICTVLTLLSIFAVPKLKFEYDTRKIRADRPESRMAKIKQDAVGFPRFSPAVVLISGEKQSEALEAAVERKKAENPRTLIDLTRSIYSLVPKDQEEKMAIIRQMIQLLSDDALNLVKGQNKEDLETFKGVLEDHSPFTLADVPPEVKKHFLGETNSESFFMIYKKPSFDLDDGRYAIRFAEELQEIKTPVGTFQATSDSIVFADVLRTLFKDSRKILVVSALCLFTFVYLNFRSWKKTALILYSIFAGVLWVTGVMFLLGIRFNLYNMVMIPAIMGMSIDNSIHIFHRYEELGPGSLGRVLGSTGISSMLASMTNAAGFIGLVFCTHGGLRSMGTIVLLGLATCLITTLVYLPMILEFFEGRKRKFTPFRRVSSSSG